jgi:putative IMPACT (imprinted ancient) family translation regulator
LWTAAICDSRRQEEIIKSERRSLMNKHEDEIKYWKENLSIMEEMTNKIWIIIQIAFKDIADIENKIIDLQLGISDQQYTDAHNIINKKKEHIKKMNLEYEEKYKINKKIRVILFDLITDAIGDNDNDGK